MWPAIIFNETLGVDCMVLHINSVSELFIIER